MPELPFGSLNRIASSGIDVKKCPQTHWASQPFHCVYVGCQHKMVHEIKFSLWLSANDRDSSTLAISSLLSFALGPFHFIPKRLTLRYCVGTQIHANKFTESIVRWWDNSMAWVELLFVVVAAETYRRLLNQRRPFNKILFYSFLCDSAMGSMVEKHVACFVTTVDRRGSCGL